MAFGSHYSALAHYVRREFAGVAMRYTSEQLHQFNLQYGQAHRNYYGTDHPIDLLQKLKGVIDHAKRPNLIAHAILWHDYHHRMYRSGGDKSPLVYRPDSENVAESVVAFKAYAAQEKIWTPDDIEQVTRMIACTNGHKPNIPKNHPHYNDLALFLDLDLSSLGATPYHQYKKNTARIRTEFPIASDSQFFGGRAVFLRAFAEREDLFYHPVTRAMYQDAAKSNMLREVDELNAIVRQGMCP